MFRWRSPFSFSLRLLQTRSVKTEPLMDQLKRCTTEYQVFQLLGMNRSAITVHHVRYTVDLLWNYQEEKQKRKPFGEIRDHPEFIALCTLAQNNMNLLEDKELVDILYTLQLFQLEAHNSLIQHLVVEGWRRLERLDLPTLDKFAVCLKKQHLNTSPLMGQIASTVDKNLEAADNPAALSSLLYKLQAVSSSRLQERLIEKIESVIQNFDHSDIQDASSVMRQFYKYKFTYYSLAEKYDNLFQQNISTMDDKNVARLAAMYQYLDITTSDFPVMAKPRLVKMMETCNDPAEFADLYAALGRMASPHIRDSLEEKLLTYLDEMSLQQLLYIQSTMVDMECKSDTLIEKFFSLLQKHWANCTPKHLLFITEALMQLSPHNTKLLKELQSHLQRKLIASFVRRKTAVLARALSLLNIKQVDEAVLSKIEATIYDCNLQNMENIAIFLMYLLDTPRVFGNHHKTCREHLQKLNSCALERLQYMDRIDTLLDEVQKVKTKAWMNEELLEGILDVCQRLLHKVTWRNVGKLSLCLIQMNYVHAPILHKIAAVTMEDISKIHPFNVHHVLLPFSHLNYEPPQGRAFFSVCLKHVLEHKDLSNTTALMQTCYNFALAKHFPKELIDAIFNITFLRQLDAQLTYLPHARRWNLRNNLMELNRAVCIEHPEYQVPWFHESFCQQMLQKTFNPITQLLQEILEEIFGGKHYVKVLSTAPYCYSIDLEFTLDKNKKPIPFQEQDSVSDKAAKMCEVDGQLLEGAQKFAVDLLKDSAFCQNTHLKGQPAMKKRHLELCGYHVIQISRYEGKSLMLMERKNQIEYLRKKIYADI